MAPIKGPYASFKNYDAASFCDDLGKVDWKKVYRCSDVDIAYLTFYHFLKDTCDKHAPIQNITLGKRKNSPRKPWVTSSIVKYINKKHKLYKAYKASNFDEIHAAKYRKYRHILGIVLKNAKRMYYSNLFQGD